MYNTIANYPWVKDGLSADESHTIEELLYVPIPKSENLEALLQLGWLQDGPSPEENIAIEWLSNLNAHDPDATKTVLAMPFLASITETDTLVLKGLFYKAHTNTLTTFLQHPTVRDGITDDEAVLVTAATTIANHDYIGKILAPRNTVVETIQTSSTHTPNLTISIVRLGTRRITDSSAIIAEAVEYVEQAMGIPLPTSHVIVLLDDSAVIDQFAGVNYGQAIAYLREGEDGDAWQRTAFRQSMVHEVAHYFWRGSENWIDEGMANTIDNTFAVTQGFPTEMTATQRQSCTLTTLEQLSTLNPDHTHPQYRCNYYLGEKLFMELQGVQSSDSFRNAITNLHQMTLALQEDGQTAGITEVKAAFPEHQHIVQKHWTGKTPVAILPTSTPVSKALPTSIPASTALPTSIPASIALSRDYIAHQNAESGFSIKLPRNWEGSAEEDRVTFQPQNSTAHILVIEQSNASRKDYLALNEDSLLHPAGDWKSYHSSYFEDTNSNAVTFWEVQYTRERNGGGCIEQGLIRVYESQHEAGTPTTTKIEIVRLPAQRG